MGSLSALNQGSLPAQPWELQPRQISRVLEDLGQSPLSHGQQGHVGRPQDPSEQRGPTRCTCLEDSSRWYREEWAFPVVKSPHTIQEMRVQSLDWEDFLEEEMATHPSVLSWEIPWTEEPGGLQSMEWQRVRHRLVTKQQGEALSAWHVLGAQLKQLR